MTSIPTIASKLTTGQADCIRAARYLDPHLYWRPGWEVSGRSANSLTLKGLAANREIRGLTGKTRRGIALTPIGEQVRTHLEKEASKQ